MQQTTQTKIEKSAFDLLVPNTQLGNTVFAAGGSQGSN